LIYLFEVEPGRLGMSPNKPDDKPILLASDDRKEIDEVARDYAMQVRGYASYTIVFHTNKGDIPFEIDELDIRNTPKVFFDIIAERLQHQLK
jgi:hypothetical protein